MLSANNEIRLGEAEEREGQGVLPFSLNILYAVVSVIVSFIIIMKILT